MDKCHNKNGGDRADGRSQVTKFSVMKFLPLILLGHGIWEEVVFVFFVCLFCFLLCFNLFLLSLCQSFWWVRGVVGLCVLFPVGLRGCPAESPAFPPDICFWQISFFFFTSES